MPRQTRHESELEVYRKEIIRLEKALTKLNDILLSNKKEVSKLLLLSITIFKALNPNVKVQALNPQQKG